MRFTKLRTAVWREVDEVRKLGQLAAVHNAIHAQLQEDLQKLENQKGADRENIEVCRAMLKQIETILDALGSPS
jgi:hypothetical protein